MPFTILVIDDDPTILEMATELLASDGHRAFAALGGEEGLARARTVGPDLILLDYHMPRMDGLAVIHRLKADAATQRIPVVALTSPPSMRTSSAGLAASASSRSRSRQRSFSASSPVS